MEQKFLLKAIEENKKLLSHLVKNFFLVQIISEKITGALKNGGKILVIGNGGSAACAQHFTCELVVKMNRERKPFPAIALSTDTSIITAVSNDRSFNEVFSRQIQGIGNSGDILLILSTSGNSINLINAAHTAREKNISVLSLLGKDGGKIKDLSDISFIVPSQNTQRIQEIHNIILHLMVELLEDELVQI